MKKRFLLIGCLSIVTVSLVNISCKNDNEEPTIEPTKKFNKTVDFKIGEDYAGIASTDALQNYLTDGKGNKPDTLFLNNTGSKDLDGYDLDADVENVFKPAKTFVAGKGIVVVGRGNEFKNVTELSEANLAFLRNEMKFKIQYNPLTAEEKRILELIQLEIAQCAMVRADIAPARKGFETGFDNSFKRTAYEMWGRNEAYNFADSVAVFDKLEEYLRRTTQLGPTDPFPRNDAELMKLFNDSRIYIATAEELARLQGNEK